MQAMKKPLSALLLCSALWFVPDGRVARLPPQHVAGDVLQTLSPREEKVIRLRFGLDAEGREHTLEEVGEDFNVTRERIRQIEVKALRKLRHPSRAACDACQIEDCRGERLYA